MPAELTGVRLGVGRPVLLPAVTAVLSCVAGAAVDPLEPCLRVALVEVPLPAGFRQLRNSGQAPAQ